MTELVVVFRTYSDVEAHVVRGLLEAHGMPSVTTSHLPSSIFPLKVDGLGEVRISVTSDDAEEARRIIESHRTELPGARVARLRDEYEDLQRAIGYRFRDRGLVEHAMTHTSRANEDPSGGVLDNENLEFLGDAVLGFVIADLLFREFPEFDEGQMSKTKATLVSSVTLARLAEHLQLGEHLLLGRGEEKTGGRLKPALLADAYEALIAAIYLDGGIEHVRAFIKREFGGLLHAVDRERVGGGDHKSELQEYLQSHDRPLPAYRLVATTGPDHRKQFEVEVVVGGEVAGRAVGASKKEAEQQAAKLAIEQLRASRSR
jgi:ribonuclease-3